MSVAGDHHHFTLANMKAHNLFRSLLQHTITASVDADAGTDANADPNLIIDANANSKPKPDADTDADDGANVDGGAVTHADRDGAPITAEEQLGILKDTMGSRSLKEMEKLLAAGMTREQVPSHSIAVVFFSFFFWM